MLVVIGTWEVPGHIYKEFPTRISNTILYDFYSIIIVSTSTVFIFCLYVRVEISSTF
jgi:hypothetical protein